MQVLQETGLINTHQRAKAHGHGGELPEVRHQLRVWVARQPLAIDFLTEVVELLFSQAAFKESACINTGGDVALQVQQVAAMIFIFSMPKVVETHAQHGRQRGKGSNVTTKVTAIRRAFLVGTNYHRHGIPAHPRAKTFFVFHVAWAAGFQVNWNGVHVFGVRRERNKRATQARFGNQLFEQVMRALGALTFKHGLQGI